MERKNRTLRLLFPQWQGGNNPDYAFGAELLAHIVPQSDRSEWVRVPVSPADAGAALPIEHGVEGEAQLLRQIDEALRILDARAPDRVIVLGGDCAVSQAPFDYLNGRYPGKLGILWLDAHPDVAAAPDSARGHEMVLGNLLGGGAPRFAERVRHPVRPSRILLAGLKHEDLRPKDRAVGELNLRHAHPSALAEGSGPVLDWIRDDGIEKLAVHFDLDVLSPADFRSIYPAEPHLADFGAAIGGMTLAQVVRLLTDASAGAEIVGLSIAEHLPWDAINLRRALSQLAIFED